MAVEMKLKEVCERYSISRRAIQGYEKAGLVMLCRKTEYGHLMYDTGSINKIIFIKFLQDLSYEIKEIREIVDLDPSLLADEMASKLTEYQEKIKEMTVIGLKAEEVISALGNGHVLDERIIGIITGLRMIDEV